jgi:hypothetical protein
LKHEDDKIIYPHIQKYIGIHFIKDKEDENALEKKQNKLKR